MDDTSDRLTVIDGGIEVQRTIQDREAGRVATYSLASNVTHPTVVRITEAIPPEEAIHKLDFHPGHRPNEWSTSDGIVQFDAIVPPSEPRVIALGLDTDHEGVFGAEDPEITRPEGYTVEGDGSAETTSLARGGSAVDRSGSASTVTEGPTTDGGPNVDDSGWSEDDGESPDDGIDGRTDETTLESTSRAAEQSSPPDDEPAEGAKEADPDDIEAALAKTEETEPVDDDPLDSSQEGTHPKEGSSEPTNHATEPENRATGSGPNEPSMPDRDVDRAEPVRASDPAETEGQTTDPEEGSAGSPGEVSEEDEPTSASDAGTDVDGDEPTDHVDDEEAEGDAGDDSAAADDPAADDDSVVDEGSVDDAEYADGEDGEVGFDGMEPATPLDRSSATPDPRGDADRFVEGLLEEIRAGHVDEESLDALRSELGVARADDVRLRHVQSRMDDFVAYAEALEEIINTHGTASEFVTGIEREVSDLSDQVATARSRADAAQETLESAETEREQLTAQLTEMRDVLDAVTEQAESMERDVRQSLESHREERAEQLEALRTELEASRRDRERELEELRSDLRETRTERDDRIEALQDQLEAVRTEREERIDELEAELETVRQDVVTEMETEFDSLRADVESLNEVRRTLLDAFGGGMDIPHGPGGDDA